MAFTVSSIVGFRQFSAEGMVGGVVALAMARELAPVLAAVVVTARAGSTMASELGNMRVNEHDRRHHDDGKSAKVQFLVVPRIVATTLMLPLLAVAFGMAGMVGAYVVAVLWQNIDPASSSIASRLSFSRATFGCCSSRRFVFAHRQRRLLQEGFHRPPAARGVGEATAKAVVASIVVIFTSPTTSSPRCCGNLMADETQNW